MEGEHKEWLGWAGTEGYWRLMGGNVLLCGGKRVASGASCSKTRAKLMRNGQRLS